MKTPKRYVLFRFAVMLFMFAMLACGYLHVISWPLVVASGIPDGVAMYFALVSLEKTHGLEEKNKRLIQHVVDTSETTLAYVEGDVWH